MKMSMSSGLAVIIALAGCSLLAVLGRVNAVISGGSDSLTEIYRPPLWSQFIALGLIVATIALTGGVDKWQRAAWILAGVLVLLMSVHLVAVSGRDQTVSE